MRNKDAIVVNDIYCRSCAVIPEPYQKKIRGLQYVCTKWQVRSAWYDSVISYRSASQSGCKLESAVGRGTLPCGLSIAQTSKNRQFMLYGNGGYVFYPLAMAHDSAALPLILRTTCGTHLLLNLGGVKREGTWKYCVFCVDLLH